MLKPTILDLFCGAGGCSAGYARAGFRVVGVDLHHQPRYPYQFFQADALTYLQRALDFSRESYPFTAIHASPPCQKYTAAGKVWRAKGKDYADLVAPVRELLKSSGLPWVIENVVGAPLENPILLCGQMFGLKTYRHRLFETSFPITAPPHLPHIQPQAKMGRVPKNGEYIQVVGNFSGLKYAQEAMGISWMGQKELAQAIPPAYTEFIGRHMINHVLPSLR